MYQNQKAKQKKLTAEQKRKKQQIHVGIKFQSSLTKRHVKLLGLANERFREVDQVKFAYADMHGNIKVIMKSPVQRKYVLRIQSEKDIANIFSKLDCEYERFDEIYPSDGT